MSDLVAEARALVQFESRPYGTHYEGCYRAHPLCMILVLAAALERAVRSAEDAQDNLAVALHRLEPDEGIPAEDVARALEEKGNDGLR